MVHILRKGSSKQRISRRSTSIPRNNIKKRSSSYRGISAAQSRTNHSSFSSVNASWDHFDASCRNHDANHQPVERKEGLLDSPKTSIDANPCTMPKKKNMLLDNDLELTLLLQQLHESADFVGTIDPLYHSHYLSSPNKDHKKLNEGSELKDKKNCSNKGLEGHATTTVDGAAANKKWLAINAVLDEQMIQWDWGILLRRHIATAILATTITMMYYGMMKKSPQKDANTAIIVGDARIISTSNIFLELLLIPIMNGDAQIMNLLNEFVYGHTTR
jgi:hypothetical protein